MSKYIESAAGKGSQPRGNTSKSNMPLWKIVKLNNGAALTPEEAAKALTEACELISLLETEEGDCWVQKYFK